MTRLNDTEIAEHLTAVSAWQRRGETITREWKCADFAAALAFVNQVGILAEAAQHHPDINLYGWNKVCLTLSTHSAGGLTAKDFTLARAIDAVSNQI